MSYLSIKSVSKAYDGVTVLDQINIEIEKGSFTTLLGPSGCGKSTLLRLISGIEKTDQGQIIIDDKDVTNLSSQERSVGLVFQHYALFPNLSVFENVAFGLRYKKEKKEIIQQKVSDMLKLVGLEHKADQYPFQLSGGQKQRIALARALILEPSVLLLDEPLSALDAKVRETLRTQIKKIQRSLNLTVIFVTHDQEEALSISDRILVMKLGKVEQDATPQILYDQPKTNYVASFIGHYNLLSSSEYETLFGEKVNEPTVILKPESIYFSETGVEVEVRESFLLGNIIRYECLAGETRLTIDCLNDHAVYQRHSIKHIQLNKNQRILIKETL